MQINAVSNTNFESNSYHLSKKGCANAQQLLELMSKGTKIKVNPSKTRWQSEILSSLSLVKDDVKFSDARIFIEQSKIPEEAVKIPDCVIKIGKNTLAFNSKTGEIINHKISLFSSMSRVIFKAEGYLKTFLDNFDKSWIVTKNTFEVLG